MDRDQLVDLDPSRAQTGAGQDDRPGPAEYRVRADTYTSAERHALDVEMVLASPQLVGYVSELPKPGSYCTKTVMGRSILLTRTSDGSVKAFDNVCLHRQSQITEGCGSARRLVCPYHAWNYDLDGNLVGVPGKEGFPESSSGRSEIDRTTGDRMRRLPLGGPRPERDARYPRVPRTARRRAGVVGHRALGAARREGARLRRSTGSSRSTPSRRTTTSRPCTRRTFATIARSNCTVFDSFGPHHRLVFPLNGILDLENVPEEQWDPLQNMVVIYALFPNIVLSATIANGELFRVYPGDVPGRSITVHQNSTPLDLSEESVAAGAQAVFEYAHGTVRDEDYALVEKLQSNLASGVQGASGVRPQRTRTATSSRDVDEGGQPLSSAMSRATSSRSPGSAASSTSASSQSRYSAIDRS